MDKLKFQINNCDIFYDKGEAGGEELLRQTLQGILHRRPDLLQGKQGLFFLIHLAI